MDRLLSSLTAAVLVGGLGTRLRSVVADRPKALAEVAGKPFLQHLLEHLEESGVRRTVLCTGHLGEQVRETFGARFGMMRLLYSQEPQPLGTAGALRHALPLFDSDQVLALNGDSWCGADLEAFASWHFERGMAASLVAAHVPGASRYGTLELEDGGRVRHFREKRAGGPGWINAGIYLLNCRLLLPIKTEEAVSLERTVLPRLVRGGLYAFRSEAPFLDIGTPESYAASEEFFASAVPTSAFAGETWR